MLSLLIFVRKEISLMGLYRDYHIHMYYKVRRFMLVREPCRSHATATVPSNSQFRKEDYLLPPFPLISAREVGSSNEVNVCRAVGAAGGPNDGWALRVTNPQIPLIYGGFAADSTVPHSSV